MEIKIRQSIFEKSFIYHKLNNALQLIHMRENSVRKKKIYCTAKRTNSVLWLIRIFISNLKTIHQISVIICTEQNKKKINMWCVTDISFYFKLFKSRNWNELVVPFHLSVQRSLPSPRLDHSQLQSSESYPKKDII